MNMTIAILPRFADYSATLERYNGQNLSNRWAAASHEFLGPDRDPSFDPPLDAIAQVLRHSISDTGLAFAYKRMRERIFTTRLQGQILYGQGQERDGALANWLVKGGAEFLGLQIRIDRGSPFVYHPRVVLLENHWFLKNYLWTPNFL